MINALTCKICNLIKIDEYCTEKIQPLLLEANGQPIYFGKYTEDGDLECYISKTYAKDPPTVKPIRTPAVHPKNIANYLLALGYRVEWVEIFKDYPAGYSQSGKTCYYKPGYCSYYSLKISI